MTERALWFSSNQTRRDAEYKSRKATWTQFIGFLLSRVGKEKDCGNLVGGLFADNYRLRSHMKFRSLLTLDADEVSPGFVLDCIEAMDYCAAVFYTTWSHLSDGLERWRIFAPLSRDVTPDEYWLIAHAVMLDCGGFKDTGGAEAERLMHLPSTRGDGTYRQHVFAGEPMDVDHWLARADQLGVQARGAPADAWSGNPNDWVTLLPGYDGQPCERVEALTTALIEDLKPDGDRHNTMARALMRLMRLGEQGHEGISEALETAQSALLAHRDLSDDGEFSRLVDGAVAKIAPEPTPGLRECCGTVLASKAPVWERRPGYPSPSGEDPGQALARCHAVFARWLGSTYDLQALNAVLATAAAEQLGGDPLWLMYLSGSGNAKTETVVALAGIGAHVESTIASEGALLSATSKRERSKDATGGLLRKIGQDGILVIKDVTSILSMSGETRGQVLGALREVYDGFWSRNVGTDGGRTLAWRGRIGLVGAVTSAWDQHHAVIAVMGDRFVIVRSNSDGVTERLASGRQALANIGSEVAMRRELAEAARWVVAAMNRSEVELTAGEKDRVLAAADLVTRGRTAVERDFKGEPLSAHSLEAPTRLAKQLGQLVRGGVAIGMNRDEALRLAIRCARDSMPPVRLRLIDDLAAFALTEDGCIGQYSPLAAIRKRVNLPRTTVDRELQAMHLLRMVTVEEEETVWRGRDVTRWAYRLENGIDPETLV